MIVFACPKCGKQFKVPDSAAGRHGWCRGCGTIIRVPKSSKASADEIVDVKIDPQVEALLHHMASQLKEYRTRTKKAEAELLALRKERDIMPADENAVNEAKVLLKKLAAQLSALEKERQAVGAELHEFLQSMRGLLESDSKPVPDAQAGLKQGRLAELESALAAEHADHAKTNERLHALQSQYSALTKESETRVDEIERLQQRLDRSHESASEMAERCGKLEEQVTSLRAERDDARRMLDERRAVEETPEAVTARLEEKESIIQRLSEELRILSASKGEMEAVSRQQLDDIEHLSAELSGITQSTDREILTLQSDLSVERKGHALAERALIHAQDDLRALRREVDALRQIEARKDALERDVVILRESLQKAEKTIQDTEARLEETQEKLRKAEKRIQTFGKKGAYLQKTSFSEDTPDAFPQNETIVQEKAAEGKPSFKGGPFPGPFIPASKQGDYVQGLALIPEVIDEDYDDREMLDTLMRFLEPEE